MADAFDDLFDDAGADFEAFMPTKPVTVESVDPNTGAALVTAEDVPALKRTRRRNPFTAQGGELAADLQRFVFAAGRLPDVVLKARDRVTESDGTVWVVDDRGAELIAGGQLWTLNVSIQRG